MTWNGERSRTSTAAHKAFRRAVLARDRVCRCSACPRCNVTPNCTRPANRADHIVPDAEGGTDELANGQGMCDECHKHKTAYEGVRHQPRRRRPKPSHPGLIDP